MGVAGAFHKGCEGLHAGFAFVAEVAVGSAGFFEAEPDMLAAAGDGGPVEKFVGW